MRGGVLLAGGRSRRFGRDKAVESFGGRPLALWPLAVLAAYAEPGLTVLAGPPDLACRLGLPAVPDAPEAAGPLAGVLAGLAWAHGRGVEFLATAPCDTPFLPPGLHLELEARLHQDPGAPCALARAGRAHPLCAVWRVPAAAPLAARLSAAHAAAGGPRLEALLRDLGAVEAVFPDEEAFANLNTAEDLERAAGRLPVP